MRSDSMGWSRSLLLPLGHSPLEFNFVLQGPNGEVRGGVERALKNESPGNRGVCVWGGVGPTARCV